jgi:predicted nucleotidyltransferase
MSREELIQSVIDVLQADDRVRATWLSGSLGRGAGDRYSDVDLVAVVAEENRAGFVAEWDGIVATIAPVVLTNRLNFGASTVFNHVTADWLRFDVAVVTPASLDRYTASAVRVLFDKDDLYSGLRLAGEPLAPSGPRVEGLTKEFMRVLGLLPVVLGREEYAVGASGSGLVRALLIQLMTEDVAVADRGGAMHLRGLLPDAQLAAINDLPPILATRESAIAVHMAVARLFLPLARDLSERTGAPWPDALESALRAHLDSELGLKLPDLSRHYERRNRTGSLSNATSRSVRTSSGSPASSTDENCSAIRPRMTLVSARASNWPAQACVPSPNVRLRLASGGRL